MARVQSNDDRNICKGCCVLLELAVAGISLWQFFVAREPNFYLKQFYFSAFSTPLDPSMNKTLFFVLQMSNHNPSRGIFYDELNLTFSYFPNRTNPIGHSPIPALFKGPFKSAKRNGSSETYGADWQAVSRAVSANGSAVFRVDLASAFRYKILLMWKSKTYHLNLGANVEVNDQGVKGNQKGIRLTSASPRLSFSGEKAPLLAGILVFALI